MIRTVCKTGIYGLLALMLLSLSALAQDENESNTIYIPMEPPFVVNYGGEGRLKYLKTEIVLRVDNVHTASATRHHMALLRNAIVMLLSRQQEETVSTQEGVELLRQTAREEINALLESEGAQPGVTEVYFNSLVIQQ